jgi:hypothetical protein
MSLYFFFFKVKELNLEILPNGKRHTFFCVLLQILFKYSKIKAKFIIGENKYLCRYYKIIWIPNLKCNTHIQVHFNITLGDLSNLNCKSNLKHNTHM